MEKLMKLFVEEEEEEEGEMINSNMPLWRKLVEMDWNLLQSIEPRDMNDRGKKMLKDDLFKSGPALVATRGLPCTGKTFWASQIASYLRCAHLDLDNVRSCILQTHPDPHLLEPDRLDELSHGVMFRLASAQLQLGHDVVVDSIPLSRPSSMHQLLLDLADSHRLPLIIFECTVISKSKWRRKLEAWNSKIKNSPLSAFYVKLDVERLLQDGPHKSFDVETINDVPRIVSDNSEYLLLNFLLLYKQNLGCNPEAPTSAIIPSNDSGQEGEIILEPKPKLKRHFSHGHPLAFVRRDTNYADCRICLAAITEPSYYCCPRCDFEAHESCIELPQFTSFTLHVHPMGLYVQSYNPIEPEEQIKCIVCNGANRGPIYRCWQCYDLFVHHKCAAHLSAELNHPCHDQHPLKLKTYDSLFSSNEFVCRACGHKGGGASYSCSACRLSVHLTCALQLPLVAAKFKCAQHHPLVLAPSPKDNVYDEYFCDVCEEERHGDFWIYYCHACEFHAHLHCVYPNIPAYDVEAAKKNSSNDSSDNKLRQSEDEDDDEDDDSGGDDDDEEPISMRASPSGCAHQRAMEYEYKDNLVGMVIAMKGGPCTGKTTLSRALAKSLRCTLASRDDILAVEAEPSDHLHKLSDEMLWRVAETELTSRQHSVVIDSPLHTQAHLDRLLALISSFERNQIMPIIIECRAQDRTEWRNRLLCKNTCSPDETERILVEDHDYDTGDVPKLTVDTTSELGIEDYLRDMESFIMSCLDKKLYGEMSIDGLAKDCKPCKEAYVEKLTADLPKTLKHQHHEHELVLYNSARTYAFKREASFWCCGCSSGGTNLFYSCETCDLSLHAKCALNLPLTFTAEFHRWHPLILTTRPLDPEMCYCDFCEERREPEEWIYFCEECEHYYHIKCTLPEFYASPDLFEYHS